MLKRERQFLLAPGFGRVQPSFKELNQRAERTGFELTALLLVSSVFMATGESVPADPGKPQQSISPEECLESLQSLSLDDSRSSKPSKEPANRSALQSNSGLTPREPFP
ncbi:MAG: hypothetical protein ACREAC_26280, partial [Blastocatellia bacterium]